MLNHQKILVVGESVVGAYLATELLRLGVDVVWCKAASDRGTRSRVVMLNQRSTNLLQAMGSNVIEQGYSIDKIQVEDLESTGNFAIDATKHQLDRLGICLDEQHLYDELAAMAPKLHPFQDYEAEINTPDTSQFDLIIATKPVANSKLLPGISATQYLALMHVSYTHQTANHRTAKQFFTKYGPIGMLPYQAESKLEKMMVIWSFNDQQKANDLYEQGQMLQELSHYTQLPLEALQLDKTFAVAPIKFKRYMHFSKKVCLISNAAYQTHPLAGQGLNMSLADAQQLLDILQTEVSIPQIKSKLQRSRLLDRLILVFGAELVLLNFTTHLPILRWLRARIMGAVNFVPQLKNILVDIANGK